MTEEQVRLAYLEWIKTYTNNDFVVDSVEVIPPMVNLVIQEMIQQDEADSTVKSESLGDYSVTFDNSEYGYSKKTMAKLEPYIKRPVTFT